MDMIRPLKDMYCAPTKLFIRSGEDGDHCKIIEVGGLHVYRTDRSFGIATLYALQGGPRITCCSSSTRRCISRWIR